MTLCFDHEAPINGLFDQPDLRFLEDFQNLEELRVHDSNVEHLDDIGRSVPGLTSLHLEVCDQLITLGGLRNFTNLRKFHLSCCDLNLGLRPMAYLKSLESLFLDFCLLPPGGGALLAQMPNLRHIHLPTFAFPQDCSLLNARDFLSLDLNFEIDGDDETDDEHTMQRTNFLLNYPGKSLAKLSWTGFLTEELIAKILSFPSLKTLVLKDVDSDDIPQEFLAFLEKRKIEVSFPSA
jgi:hypothetical protein